MMMIGLLTEDFALYHDMTRALKERSIPFISLSFDESIPSNIKVILTSVEEKDKIDFEKAIGCENIDFAIDEALRALSGKDEHRVLIGIDPGEYPGVAIFENDILLRSFIATPESIVKEIKSLVDEYEKMTVRIGNGARLPRNRIINSLQELPIRLEIVDESSTSLGGDTVSASNIALIPGRRIEKKLSVEPTKGEIKKIQEKSRKISKEITISQELAKKVLKGEMELEKAIEKQKS